jgi:hypothetical protein
MARTAFQFFDMSESTQSDQGGWLVADLSRSEKKRKRPPSLTDATAIVRYVRLSTLFLYLSNRAFIPSLECLRGMDKFEGEVGLKIPLNSKIRSFVFDKLENEFSKKDFELYPPTPFWDGLPNKNWRKELAKRRAIWRWNLEEESNAMWQLYGSKGVQIKSKVGRLKKALANAGCTRRLMAPIRYSAPSTSEISRAEATFDPENKATWPFWLMRPYLFKRPTYQYEQEIRFIFGIQRLDVEKQPGIIVRLDAKTLIEDIVCSELIPEGEKQLIGRMFRKIKSGKMSMPEYPAEYEKSFWYQWDNPFTDEDDYPELFPDLTEYGLTSPR